MSKYGQGEANMSLGKRAFMDIVHMWHADSMISSALEELGLPFFHLDRLLHALIILYSILAYTDINMYFLINLHLYLYR